MQSVAGRPRWGIAVLHLQLLLHGLRAVDTNGAAMCDPFRCLHRPQQQGRPCCHRSTALSLTGLFPH